MHSNLETNQLFVSGTPQDSTEEQIKEYFDSRFGLIHKVKLLQTGNRSRNFLIMASDAKIYQAILGAKDLMFRDRVLHCKPYIDQKSHLRNQIQEANDRRVILKKVPAKIPQSKISTLIEKIAGEIELIFPYRAETLAQAQFQEFRKFRTYSVLFRNKASAERLARLGNITLDDGYSQPIKIEKYCYRRGERQQPTEQGSLQRKKQYKYPTSTQYGPRRTFEQYQEGHQISRSGQTPENSNARPMLRIERSSNLYDGSLKLLRVDINAKFHSMKPTTKNYFSSNKKFLIQPECGLQIRLLVKSPQAPEKMDPPIRFSILRNSS